MSTPVGSVSVDRTPTQAFITDNYAWPFGLATVAGVAPGEQQRLGLPMYDGDRVMVGFKLQQSHFPAREAELACYQNRAYVAAGVADLARGGWRGTLVAGTYQRPKGGVSEVGLTLFVVPELPYAAPGGAFNIAFEAAQWKTVERFIKSFDAGYLDREAQPIQNILSAEPCPSTQMGNLGPLLMLQNGVMFLLDRYLHDDDPMWPVLARAGILQLSWLPCVVMHHSSWELNRG
jgi:hypothetical protein